MFVPQRALCGLTIAPRVAVLRIILFLSALCATAQDLSIVFIGGASPTADFQNQILFQSGLPGLTNYSTPKRYIFGASLEYRWTSRFSIELDALYHPLGYTFAAVEPDGSLNSVSPATVVTWEFPILAKYRFAYHRVSPFVEAGPSFRTTGNLNSANPSHVGATAGVGVEMHAGALLISPEIRYTRRQHDPQYAVPTVPDQVELLVGFSGNPPANAHPLGTRVSLGAILGVSILGDFRPTHFGYTDVTNGGRVDSFNTAGPRQFIPGAMLDVAIGRNFSVETDAIYDRLSASSRTVVSGGFIGLYPGSYDYTQAEWKFPVLAKYRFAEGRLRPVVELGPSFRIPPGASTLSPYGLTAGAGFESHWRWLRVSPVLRYTRWASERPPGYSYGNPNQLEFFTGFSF